MKYVIHPDIMKGKAVAFFTGKSPGAEREHIADISGYKTERIYLPIQRHTGKVIDLKKMHEPEVADAVVTAKRGILLGVRVADCVPLLLLDRVKNVLGAVHAGWRGTAQGIIKNTISLMADRYGSDAADILIAIGPAIRWCCYKVGPEVLDAVSEATGGGEYHMQRDGGLCLDLPSANRVQALSMGVRDENVWMSDECTFCHPEKFHSYRYVKDHTGRQGGFIGLKKEGHNAEG